MPRPLGSINRSKTEAADFARQIVNDPEYRTSLRTRAIAGTLPPAVESLLWYYAFGRPIERMVTELSVTSEPLASLDNEQLALRAERVVRLLRSGRPEDDDDDPEGEVH